MHPCGAMATARGSNRRLSAATSLAAVPLLLLLVLWLGSAADGFPLPFPELDATVSRALGEGRGPFPIGAAACARPPPPRGYRAAGYFPDAALYVDDTGARERAEYGAQRSMADVMQYPNPDYAYQPAEPDYAAFGAPEATMPQEEAEEEGRLEDDTPMPGDTTATVDSGREPEPLREGERIVEDGPLDFDDTEIIPLAGEEPAADGPSDPAGDGPPQPPHARYVA